MVDWPHQKRRRTKRINSLVLSDSPKVKVYGESNQFINAVDPVAYTHVQVRRQNEE